MTDLIRKLGILLIIPIFFILLDFYGVFNKIENQADHWRYQFRGELPSPGVKLIYADLDRKAMKSNLVGERPWDRALFADVATILIGFGNARAVGYDFIFSPKAYSKMVPAKNIAESNQKLAKVSKLFSGQLIFAASYTGVQLAYMDQPSDFPFYYKGSIDPTKNPCPEMPTYPILGYDWGTGERWGRVGLINVDERRNTSAEPQWLPLFAEYEGPAFMRNIALGMAFDMKNNGISLNVAETNNTFELIDETGTAMFTVPANSNVTFYTMGIELALSALGVGHEAIQRKDSFLSITDPDGSEAVNIPLTDNQLMEINWFSRWESPLNPRVSIYDLFYYHGVLTDNEKPLNERKEAAEWFEQFKDAIILVGPVEATLQDLAPSPWDDSEVPKVGVHGNVLKTILTNTYISRASRSTHWCYVLFLSLIVSTLSVYSGRWSLMFKAGAVGIIAFYAFANLSIFAQAHFIFPLIAPVSSALVTLIVGAGTEIMSQEKQKTHIKKMFGTYVSPDVVYQMIDSGQEPQLGGVQENITAFFSDVEGFSTFSEILSPHQLVELMNEYLTAMSDIIQEEGGTVDKFIGDAIVAMFGAPLKQEDHALRACVAAARIQAKQLELQQKWSSEGSRWPASVSRMRTRIGLNSGPSTVGNMGSSTRFNYTMMGDTVNLAARCESGAASYGAYTIITEETKAKLGRRQSEFAIRLLDKVRVKGRAQPVLLYELLGKKELLTSQDEACLAAYEAGLKAYFSQDWDEAIGLFKQAADIEKNNPETNQGIKTNPSLVMLARCTELKNHPPIEGWDGVHNMTSK
jgi:adenylate cyclase